MPNKKNSSNPGIIIIFMNKHDADIFTVTLT